MKKQSSVRSLFRAAMDAKTWAPVLSNGNMSRRNFLRRTTVNAAPHLAPDNKLGQGAVAALTGATTNNAAYKLSSGDNLVQIAGRTYATKAQPKLLDSAQVFADADVGKLATKTTVAPLPHVATVAMLTGASSRRGFLKKLMASAIDPNTIPAVRAYGTAGLKGLGAVAEMVA